MVVTTKKISEEKQEIKKNYYITGFSFDNGDLITISEKAIGNVVFGHFKPNGVFKLLKITNSIDEGVNFIKEKFTTENIDQDIKLLGNAVNKYNIIKLFDVL